MVPIGAPSRTPGAPSPSIASSCNKACGPSTPPRPPPAIPQRRWPPTTAGEIDSGGEVHVSGILDLVNGNFDAAGASPSGTNIYILPGGSLNVLATGRLDVHREIAVRGTLDNAGTINVSNSIADWMSVGCAPGDPNPDCTLGGGVVTNTGTLNLGYDVDVRGTFVQQAGTLNLGCEAFSPCVPSANNLVDGAIHVQSGGTSTTGGSACLDGRRSLGVHQRRVRPCRAFNASSGDH
jgi:hypothetical protein